MNTNIRKMTQQQLQLLASGVSAAGVCISVLLLVPAINDELTPVRTVTDVVADRTWQKPIWSSADPNQGEYGGRINVRWKMILEYPDRMRLGDTIRLNAIARITDVEFVNVRKLSDGESQTGTLPVPNSSGVTLPGISEEAIRQETEKAFENDAVTLRLSIAGADTAPDFAQKVYLHDALVWTVHPKTAGRHEGVLYSEVKRNALLKETAIERPAPESINIALRSLGRLDIAAHQNPLRTRLMPL